LRSPFETMGESGIEDTILILIFCLPGGRIREAWRGALAVGNGRNEARPGMSELWHGRKGLSRPDGQEEIYPQISQIAQILGRKREKYLRTSWG